MLTGWRTQSASAEGLVFPSATGERLDNVTKAWTSVLGAAGITSFRWHDMRHHFASKLVMLGVDLNTVRELLGHSTYAMTLRYTHLAPQHAAAAVARLVGPTWPTSTSSPPIRGRRSRGLARGRQQLPQAGCRSGGGPWLGDRGPGGCHVEHMRQVAAGKGTGRYAKRLQQRQADWQHLIRYSEVIRARQRGLSYTKAYLETPKP